MITPKKDEVVWVCLSGGQVATKRWFGDVICTFVHMDEWDDPVQPGIPSNLPVLYREQIWMDEASLFAMNEYKGWTGKVTDGWQYMYMNVTVLMKDMFNKKRFGYKMDKKWFTVDIGDGKKGYWNPEERKKRLNFNAYKNL